MSAIAPATVEVEIDPETQALLDRIARETGQKPSDLLRNALRNGMLDLEEFFSAAETLARIDRGEETTISSAELRRGLGLDH